MSDELTIIVAGYSVNSWENVRVVLSLEQFPNTFVIEMTESYDPKSATPFFNPVRAGQDCQILIGGTLVITGAIDEVNRQTGPELRSVSISGRGKGRNLVDCTVPISPISLNGTPSIKEIAEHFCNLYNIKVVVDSDVTLPTFPGVYWSYSQTPFSIIDQYANTSGCVVYEDKQGNLVIARLSALGKHASGFVEGLNVQQMASKQSVTERYGTYNLLSPGYQPGPEGAEYRVFAVNDPSIDQTRTLNVVSSYWDQFQSSPNTSPLETAAYFTMNRRIGRSNSVNLICDSWRDAAGTLWAIGNTAICHLPSIGINDVLWMIGTVIFNRSNDSGTTSEITLMDAKAFAPELINTSIDPTFILAGQAASIDGSSGGQA